MRTEPIYCQLWNAQLRKPIYPVTADQARKRDEQARAGKDVEHYAVVFGDPALPDAYLNIVWENDHIGVWFPDADGRPTMNWKLTQVGDRMFLTGVTHWLYPDGAGTKLRDALAISSRYFKPDGLSEHQFKNKETGHTTVVEKKDVPLEGFWAPVPTFEEITYEWIPEWIREAGKDIRSKGALTRDEILAYAPD
ncbi:hypothetical protein [Nocardioides speluncae]|uniref:hypothetical protein n=1 Tax=Nocardioides speluncae TaxID=2670337 RepID=UPI0012B177A4|nr:hypothetical protein [Nocardioides speluncae]